jgi:hypothetical protein
MRTSLFALLAAAIVPFVAALDEPLDIEKVITKECDRKSARGDTVEVHYRGTLTDGISTPITPTMLHWRFVISHASLDIVKK